MNKLFTNSGPASGFKDYYGAYAEQRNLLIQEITKVFRIYGYERLETPAVERIETLRGKGGVETEKLIYEVLDTSKESKLGLRFDLTVPLARYISHNTGSLQFPFKRFAYGDVFRGETPQMQKGRLRGFMQCDADCVGIKNDLVDTEIILLMLNIFQTLGVDVTIKINNRGLLDSLMDVCKVENKETEKKLIGIIDEVEKIGLEKSLSIAREVLLQDQFEIFENYLRISGDSNAGILDKLKSLLSKSENFKLANDNLSKVCELLGNTKNVVIDPKIARGLDYYTGIIYETFINEVPEVGSVCSGGRYDNLIEDLGGPSLPAVGTSVGLDRLLVALEKLNKVNDETTHFKVFVTVFGLEMQKESIRVTEILRKHGIQTLLWVNPETKLSKQLSECSKLKIPFAVIIGSEEVEKDVILVKHMNLQSQKEMKVEELLSEILNQ